MANLPIVAVSGPHGSGKSTIAKGLANLLDYTYVSAGNMFRKMADQNHLSIQEFSKVAEVNEEIDKQIDERTVNLANDKDNLVVDAQLSGWLLKDLGALSVFITAPLETRVKRMAQRDGKQLEYTRSETIIREKSEKLRYQKLYNIDIADLSVYDLIVNSEKFDASNCIKIIMTAFKKLYKGE